MPCSSSRTTPTSATNNGAQSLTIATNQGDQVPVEARLFSSPWEGESALVLMLTGLGSSSGGDDRQKTFESALRHAKAEVGEVRDILDAAADGVVVLDQDAHVQSVNRGAEKLFGYHSSELTGLPFASLFAPESQRDVERIASAAPASLATKVRAGAATSSAAAAKAA